MFAVLVKQFFTFYSPSPPGGKRTFCSSLVVKNLSRPLSSKPVEAKVVYFCCPPSPASAFHLHLDRERCHWPASYVCVCVYLVANSVIQFLSLPTVNLAWKILSERANPGDEWKWSGRRDTSPSGGAIIHKSWNMKIVFNFTIIAHGINRRAARRVESKRAGAKSGWDPTDSSRSSSNSSSVQHKLQSFSVL